MYLVQFRRYVLAFSVQAIVAMVALAIVVQFTLLCLSYKPIEAVDLWCGKTYKPQ